MAEADVFIPSEEQKAAVYADVKERQGVVAYQIAHGLNWPLGEVLEIVDHLIDDGAIQHQVRGVFRKKQTDGLEIVAEPSTRKS